MGIAWKVSVVEFGLNVVHWDGYVRCCFCFCSLCAFLSSFCVSFFLFVLLRVIDFIIAQLFTANLA